MILYLSDDIYQYKMKKYLVKVVIVVIVVIVVNNKVNRVVNRNILCIMKNIIYFD